MQRRSAIGMCLFLGLVFSAFEAAQRAIGSEPLPDVSMMAYRSHPKSSPQPKVSDVTLTGVIAAVQFNGLTITASKTNKARNQKQWFVVLSPSGSTEVTIHGMATPDYLRHGQIVEFTGQLIKNEIVADKVNELTIVAYKRGESPFKRGSAKEHTADSGVGGRVAAPKSEADSRVLALADDPKTGDAGQPAAATGGTKTKIVGRIATRDENRLTVTSGERTIHADLADMPTIHVEIFNPKVVQNGSKIEIQGAGASGHLVSLTPSDLSGAKIIVRGTGAESKSGNECVARSVEITLAVPLTGKKPAAVGKKTPNVK